MKKIYSLMAAIILASTSATMFTSCDGDTKEDEPQPVVSVKEYGLKYGFYVSPDVAAAYDIAFSFEGRSMALSSQPQEVTIRDEKVMMHYITIDGTSTVLPIEADATVTFTVKDGYTLPEENVFRVAVMVNTYKVNTDGTEVAGSKDISESTKRNMQPDGLVEYTNALNTNFGHFHVAYTEKGLSVTNVD